MLEYKGYVAEYSQEEDGTYYGHVVNTRDGIDFHSETLDDLEAEFHASVDYHLEYFGDRACKPVQNIFAQT